MKIINEVLHTSSDWYKKYILSPKINFDGAKAIMKIRDSKTDIVLCEATCTISNNTITAHISWEGSSKIPRSVTRGVYDLFILLPLKNGEYIKHKLVMGDVKIIHDISLH